MSFCFFLWIFVTEWIKYVEKENKARLRFCLPFARVFKCSADIFPRGMFSEHVFLPKGKRILVSGGQHKIKTMLIYLRFLNESEALLMPWRLARIEINFFRMSTWHFASWCFASKHIKMKIFSNFFNYASFFLSASLINFL